jgi:hypothetical protein
MLMPYTKKLNELRHWERIGEVDAMLDAGEKPKTVHEWINANGFKISHPLVYEYAKRRKLETVEKILAGKYITPIDVENPQDIKRVPIVDVRPGAMAVKRLKSELDALEVIIQLGYNTLINSTVEVTPKLMMEAIDLKNKLTGGAYGHYTEFGLHRLKKLEKQKMEEVGKVLMTFVPEDRREEAIAAISDFEDDFYMDTEYYAEYRQASGEC